MRIVVKLVYSAVATEASTRKCDTPKQRRGHGIAKRRRNSILEMSNKKQGKSEGEKEQANNRVADGTPSSKPDTIDRDEKRDAEEDEAAIRCMEETPRSIFVISDKEEKRLVSCRPPAAMQQGMALISYSQALPGLSALQRPAGLRPQWQSMLKGSRCGCLAFS